MTLIMSGDRPRRLTQSRPWTYYVLAALFAIFLCFLYGPMLVIYILSFQGPEGGVTFPMVGWSFTWFGELFDTQRIGDLPTAFLRSMTLAPLVAVLTTVLAIMAGLAFRRRFIGSSFVFYVAIASLVMPSMLVGFGISLTFRLLGLEADLYTSGLGAQLTLTLPQGILAMLVIFARFDGRYEEAAADLGATPWQRFRLVVLPLVAPGVIGVAIASFTLSYDEFSRTVLTAGRGNTLPMELQSLTTTYNTPKVFAAGSVTTAFSFCCIGLGIWAVTALQRRRTAKS